MHRVPMNQGFDFETDLAGPESETTRKYANLLAKSAGTADEPNLYLPSASDLTEWGALVVAATLEDEPVSGLYVLEPKPNVHFIGGVICDVWFRKHGLTDQLLDSTMEALTRTGASCFELDVRILAGRPNHAAYHLFVKRGFSSVGVRRVALTGSGYDKHLFKSAEADGKSILSLRMRARLFLQIREGGGMTSPLFIEGLGLTAGIVVCIAALPRVFEIVGSPRRAIGESLARNALIVAGNVLWVAYGALMGAPAIAVMCALNVALNGAIFWAAWQARRQ